MTAPVEDLDRVVDEAQPQELRSLVGVNQDLAPGDSDEVSLVLFEFGRRIGTFVRTSADSYFFALIIDICLLWLPSLVPFIDISSERFNICFLSIVEICWYGHVVLLHLLHDSLV